MFTPPYASLSILDCIPRRQENEAKSGSTFARVLDKITFLNL